MEGKWYRRGEGSAIGSCIFVQSAPPDAQGGVVEIKGEGRCSDPCPDSGSTDWPCGGACPADSVNWHQAAAFCNALSAAAGLATCYRCSGSGKDVICNEQEPGSAWAGRGIYTCPGFRLPTEAEWEYAARAGTSTAYYNGQNLASHCAECKVVEPRLGAIAWYCANSRNLTWPVARLQPNAWGLYDLLGNILEWCHDAHASGLGTAPVTDPVSSDPQGSAQRTLRGGDYGLQPFSLTVSARFRDRPDNNEKDYGLRYVRTVAP